MLHAYLYFKQDRLPDVDLSVELRHPRNGATKENFSERPASGDDETMKAQRVKKPRSESQTRDSSAQQPNVSYPRYSSGLESDMLTSCLDSLVSSTEDNNGYPSTDMPPTVFRRHSNIHVSGYKLDEQHDGARCCIDGVVALSIQNEQPGYLGLAPSATLLHLIQSYSSSPFFW
jgi:hypothetical protein